MPLIISYGVGVDSTAMLIGLHQQGIRPDDILFADTGSEKPETYNYLRFIGEWLDRVGFPEVTIVKYVPVRAPYKTLEENCLVNLTLPGLAFGRKSCSQKWKGQPLDKWVKAKYGKQKVLRAIGYDAGPKDSRRGKMAHTETNHWWFPLRHWGWDREECIRQIQAAGLPVPAKSCCFFCPAMKPAELRELAYTDPELARRAVAIEDGAQARQKERRANGEKAILGLWGMGTRGIRSEKKPGRWRTFLEENCPGVLNTEK